MNIKFIERKQCISCNSQNIKTLLSIPLMSDNVFDYLQSLYGNCVRDLNLENQNLEYSFCINCSLVWQKYILNESGLNYLYETLISSEWSLSKRERGSYKQFESSIEEAKRVRYFYPNQKPRDVKVLDFGMGWGHYCIASNAVGFDVYGSELSDVRIKYAQRNGVKLIKNTKEINSNYFDFINTEQVLEHVANPGEILGEFFRILKDKGILKISVPNSGKSIKNLKLNKWKPAIDPLQPLEHINSFTPQSLKSFALNHNFINVTPDFNQQLSIKNFLKEKIKPYFATSLYFKKRN